MDAMDDLDVATDVATGFVREGRLVPLAVERALLLGKLVTDKSMRGAITERAWRVFRNTASCS
jgi:hypothetical protein